MSDTNPYLKLFFGSSWELGLVLSWTKITLDEVDEDGGFIIFEVCSAEAEQIFEKYEKLYVTSFKSYAYQCLIIYFDPLHNQLEKVQNQILSEMKRLNVNTVAQRFQM